MLFSRSSHGLSNMHLFYGVDVMVYIEGENCSKKYDTKFYEIIFNKLLGIDSKKFKISPLGNCHNVEKRYHEILSEKISNSICVLDRDYKFIKESPIYNPNLLKFTYGYSWENDFWSDNIIHKVLETLSGGRVSSCSNFLQIMNNTKESIKKISCYDLVSQVHSQSLLDKSKSSFGVKLEYDSSINSLISLKEIKRIRNKISLDILKCSVSKEIFKESTSIIPQKLIQGHFWHKVSLVIVIQLLKVIGETSVIISEQLIFNIAQSIFNKDVDSLMDDEARNYYRQNFKIC